MCAFASVCQKLPTETETLHLSACKLGRNFIKVSRVIGCVFLLHMNWTVEIIIKDCISGKMSTSTNKL